MTEIILQLPDEHTPGYLKRMKKLLTYQDAVKNPELKEIDKLDAMIGLLVDYVKEPADRDAAYDALMEADKEQIDSVFEIIAGKGDAAVPPVKGES